MKMILYFAVVVVSFLTVKPAIAQQNSSTDSILSKKFKAFKTEKNVDAKEKMFQKIERDYSPEQSKEASKIFKSMYAELAASWFKNENMSKYTAYAQKVDYKWSIYSRVLSTLQGWNKDHKNLAFARSGGKQILHNLDNQEKEGVDSYNSYVHAMFLDTYAQILQTSGDIKQSLNYYRQAANKYKDVKPDFSLRYAAALSSDGQNEQALDVLASATKNSMYNDKTTAELKRLYRKTHGGMNGFRGYFDALKDSAFQRAYTKMLDEKVDTTRQAPNFELENLEGETVSLEKMRGKVVVVDFWATWCGPCKASFPGMQRAMQQYKDDSDVIFLYVDTYEQVDNAKKKVQAFLDKKGYPFDVVLDNQNSIAKKFGVSLIPNKFVIDRQGNILFELPGFSGTDAAVSNHISAMIEIARKEG